MHHYFDTIEIKKKRSVTHYSALILYYCNNKGCVSQLIEN